MPDLDYKIEYEQECASDDYALPVIVVAAGNAQRMGGINKVFAPIYNIPVIVHTLRAFERSKFISRIIVVSKQEDMLDMQKNIEKFSIKKVTDIICGGASRQESVKNGLLRLGKNDVSVLIHDGARPVVSENIIENVVLALKDHKSVACAVAAKDTIKRVDNEGIVKETLNRSELVCVQTPQGVRIEDYINALQYINLTDFTDDTSIMESIGIKSKIVPGDYHNIKITTPEDLVIAQYFLKEDEY